MKKQDTSRGPIGKRREGVMPSSKPVLTQPQAVREVTEQELKRV